MNLLSHATLMSRRLLLGGGIGIMAIPMRIGAARAAPSEDPRAVVQYVAAEGLAAADPRLPFKQRFHRLRKLFSHYFDIGHIAAFALGHYRRLATPEQLRQYNHLYVTFTVEVYGGQLAQYANLPVRVTDSRLSEGEPVVTTEISRPDAGPVKIDWYLVDRHGRWKVGDVNIGGISMKDSQRQYFAQWIETNGGQFGALLAVMRQVITASRQGAI
ncbi:MAG TPA: ABC transporter substrate-binding protein [Stellaceae bacterium]|nr:ABC transporter substrate-binding protein [Stellaceae bacterium]